MVLGVCEETVFHSKQDCFQLALEPAIFALWSLQRRFELLPNAFAQFISGIRLSLRITVKLEARTCSA